MKLAISAWKADENATVAVDAAGVVHVVASGGRAVATFPRTDFTALGALSFKARTTGPVSVRMTLAGGRSGAWRRVRLAAGSNERLQVPLRWFPWSEGRPAPTWREVTTMALEFQGEADLWLSEFEVAPGTPWLTAEDVANGLPVHALDSVVLVGQGLDLRAFERHFADVRAAMAADFDGVATIRPILVLRGDRQGYLSHVRWFADRLNAKVGDPRSDAFTLQGVAFGSGSALRPSHTHEYVHSLLKTGVRLPGYGDWLREGAAARYQTRFHPQASLPGIVRAGLKNADLRLTLAQLCVGGRIPADRHWQAMTVVDWVLDKGRMAEVVEAAVPIGTADLSKAIGQDWADLEAEWLAHARVRWMQPAWDIGGTLPRPMKARPDFGTFIIPNAPNEADIVRDLIRQATFNPKKPSEKWANVYDATNQQFGYTVEGHRVLHVDVKRRTLEVTEEWGGVVTARKTTPLNGVF